MGRFHDRRLRGMFGNKLVRCCFVLLRLCDKTLAESKCRARLAPLLHATIQEIPSSYVHVRSCTEWYVAQITAEI